MKTSCQEPTIRHTYVSRGADTCQQHYFCCLFNVDPTLPLLLLLLLSCLPLVRGRPAFVTDESQHSSHPVARAQFFTRAKCDQRAPSTTILILIAPFLGGVQLSPDGPQSQQRAGITTRVCTFRPRNPAAFAPKAPAGPQPRDALASSRLPTKTSPTQIAIVCTGPWQLGHLPPNVHQQEVYMYT